MTFLAFSASFLAILPVLLILSDIILQGAPAVNLGFLTNLPSPVGVAGGGIANAIEGTMIMVGLAVIISVPIGVSAGIFNSEWPESRISLLSSFMSDVLAEFPSIVIGIFVYLTIVLLTGTFSALAGSVALAIIMIPIVARTTEESLKAVPASLREASLALGISRMRTILNVVMANGKSGIATGILLAVARASGESAPLIMTSLGSSYFSTSLLQPTAALPLLIYVYGISPFQSWHQLAWGAALVLVSLMLIINLSVKFFINKQKVRR